MGDTRPILIALNTHRLSGFLQIELNRKAIDTGSIQSDTAVGIEGFKEWCTMAKRMLDGDSNEERNTVLEVLGRIWIGDSSELGIYLGGDTETGLVCYMDSTLTALFEASSDKYSKVVFARQEEINRLSDIHIGEHACGIVVKYDTQFEPAYKNNDDVPLPYEYSSPSTQLCTKFKNHHISNGRLTTREHLNLIQEKSAFVAVFNMVNQLPREKQHEMFNAMMAQLTPNQRQYLIGNVPRYLDDFAPNMRQLVADLLQGAPVGPGDADAEPE